MAGSDRAKSLQDVLRARRETKPLLTVEQLRLRELERQREQTTVAAREAVDSWRWTGRAPDAAGALADEVYREIAALDAEAYAATRRWQRGVREQLRAAPACEVTRCSEGTEPRVVLVDRRAAGSERAGRDLITLCTGCARRARRLAADRGKLVSREEIVALDPRRPLYDEPAIARLKARYARPLRRSDVHG